MGDEKYTQSFCGEIRKKETTCDIQMYKKSNIKMDLKGKVWEWTGLIWLTVGTRIGVL
jgi:hypothetical protein